MDMTQKIILVIASVAIVAHITHDPVKVVKVTHFKPAPDEIHENDSEICYGWKFASPMGWKKLIRICEEK